MGMRRGASSSKPARQRHDCFRGTGGGEKIFSPRIARNPLKRLISVERPRISKQIQIAESRVFAELRGLAALAKENPNHGPYRKSHAPNELAAGRRRSRRPRPALSSPCRRSSSANSSLGATLPVWAPRSAPQVGTERRRARASAELGFPFCLEKIPTSRYVAFVSDELLLRATPEERDAVNDRVQGRHKI